MRHWLGRAPRTVGDWLGLALGAALIFGGVAKLPALAAALGQLGVMLRPFLWGLVLAYVLLLLHLARLAVKVEDPLGSYIISGVLAMYLFHIVENICMVLGLLPVTGIPLPFMSYGGSNMLTNMMGLGLVMNVVMRDRQKKNQLRETPARASRI